MDGRAMRNFITCENEHCRRIILIESSEVVKVDGRDMRLCRRCAQRLERQDERELLEEDA